jgi:Cys-rich protein (TIGR01571 family)
MMASEGENEKLKGEEKAAPVDGKATEGKAADEAPPVDRMAQLDGALNKKTPLDAKGLTTNICGWTTDITGCIVSCCVPCVVIAVTDTLLEERDTGVFDYLCCANGYQTRQRMRAKYSLPMDPMMDCVGACCCMVCFTHQNARELAHLTGTPNKWLPANGPAPAAAEKAPEAQAMNA